MVLVTEASPMAADTDSVGIVYDNQNALRQVQARLRTAPPLVASQSIDRLRDVLANLGDAYVLQIGDCAEPFDDATFERTQSKVSFYETMQHGMANALGQPVVLITRMAGQYMKPRSLSHEDTPDGRVLTYRGDGVHGFDLHDRAPDPGRLWSCYQHAQSVLDALQDRLDTLYVAHEALSLAYETALTREVGGVAYDQSAHFLWLGMRTLESQAHLAHLAKIRNPIALKIGPTFSTTAVLHAIQCLNPMDEAGRLTLITRLGAACARDRLPALIESVQGLGVSVTWLVDPMHGNTHKDAWGRKYRCMTAMEEEVLATSSVHQVAGSRLGGMHVEASGDTDLLECVDSLDQLKPNRAYKSLVDPRLNSAQCMRLIQCFVDAQAGLRP